MSEREDEVDVLRAWREVPRVLPGAALDAQVLANARRYRMRRRLMPLMALAACLLLATLGLQRSAPVAPPKPAVDARQVETRAAAFLMRIQPANHALAAPDGID
jgi:hypothetical protein